MGSPNAFTVALPTLDGTDDPDRFTTNM